MKYSASKKTVFDRFSSKITRLVGSTGAFSMAFLVVIVWAATGPVFKFSDTWQLVINTGTTVVTFLMVFVIQKSQNKDSRAIQLKLNELIAASEKASNRMINVEDLSEQELIQLSQFFGRLAEMAKKDQDLHISHSIEEAMDIHVEKLSKRGRKHKRM